MKKTKLGQILIEGMNEILEWQQGKIDLRVTTFELPDPPPDLGKKNVKHIREVLLKVSQPVLAHFLGVSDKTIKAWEQGLSKPNGSATRLLQLAEDRPEEFLQMILRASNKGA